jgi:type I restriction enzyme, S subunit
MAGDWRGWTIGGLCEAGVVELQTGPFGSQLHAHDYVKEGVPVVPTEAIRDRQIDRSLLPKITAQKANQLERHRLRAGDILFARRGVQATGHIGCVREAEAGFLCGTGAIRLRVIDDGSTVFPEFLSHVLSSSKSIEWFKFHAIGATMPNLNEGIIRDFALHLPPYEEQRAIANVLSALDDKIELNRRMNETLEAMARALFKSWFVDFDPVRAKAAGRDPGLPKPLADLFPDSFEESELGEVPLGWEIRGLDEIARFLNGLALQKFPPQDAQSLPVIKIAELRAGNTEGADRACANLHAAYVVLDGDVLFSWSGSLECVLWAGGRGALNQHLFKVTSAQFPNWFYYLWITHHLPEFRRIAAAKATTMGHIQRYHLSAAKVVLPSARLLEAADKVIGPCVDSIPMRFIQSRTLAALRDALLPKLISGEIRVKGLGTTEALRHRERNSSVSQCLSGKKRW